MGLFSIFKKKPDPEPLEVISFRRPSNGKPARATEDAEAERARQREIARATAAKIDAIESAMTFDIFNTPEPAWGSSPRRPAAAVPADAGDGPATVPLEDPSTTVLLDDAAVACGPDGAPEIEESAILYANGQHDAAEALLQQATRGEAWRERVLWWMLFDLYQASNRQDAFENAAIDYASRFETSPPSWVAPAPAASVEQAAGVVPAEMLPAVLDLQVAPQLERLLELSATSQAVRLDVARVQALNADGCALLAEALARLRQQGCELIMAGGAELMAVLRASVAVGRRDDSPAPWLLLLELLQLSGQEKAFEEAAMDYCVTFEVSPPSYVAPRNVATAASGRGADGDRFMLPALLGGQPAGLAEAIDAYAARCDMLVFDCLHLQRAEYAAAGALLAQLRALQAQGKEIALRDLNHLVATLFKLLGFADIAKLVTRKV